MSNLSGRKVYFTHGSGGWEVQAAASESLLAASKCDEQWKGKGTLKQDQERKKLSLSPTFLNQESTPKVTKLLPQ